MKQREQQSNKGKLEKIQAVVKWIEQNKGVAKQGCNEAREQQRREQWTKGMQFFVKTIFQVGHIYIQEREAKASCHHWTMMPPKA